MKIFVPISHNGNCDVKSGYAACLASAFNGCHVHIEEMGGSHADRQCSNMANFFLSKTDCDVMLIVDCDTVFSARDVQRALGHIERGYKAIWGLYPKKSDLCEPCLNTWPDVPPPDEFGLVNVRRAGRGFLMVTRWVFEQLKEDNGGPALRFHNHGDEPEWAFFRSGVVTGERSAMLPGVDGDGYPNREWISEDWFFAEDLRIHLGIPCMVDTGIILAHVGSKTYRFPASSLVRVDANITSWRDIHGWFDYEDFYRFLVSEIPHGGSFAEVGCWLGRSIAAFDAFAKEAEKSFALTAVDTFDGKPANDEHAAILEAHRGSVREAFHSNMNALGVRVGTITKDSAAGASCFEEASLDAVFIDADHSLEAVYSDLKAWVPKVKEGGIIAGHDFDEPGVKRAVEEYFEGWRVETMGRCWWVRVEKEDLALKEREMDDLASADSRTAE